MNKDQLMSLIRQGLTLVGGFLAIKGLVGEADWTTLMGTAMALISGAWSMFTHKTV